MIKTEHDKFIFKSALKPLLIALLLNTLVIGMVFLGKKLSAPAAQTQPPLVKYAVLGESISPTPKPTVALTNITPTPPLDYSIKMDGAFNRYSNAKYKFTFLFPIDWSLTQTTDITCGYDESRITVCEQVIIKSPSFQNFHIQFTSLEDSSNVRADVPEGKHTIFNTGYVWMMGNRTYWNILSDEDKKVFLCYGMHYKLCDKYQFSLKNASLYIYGGDYISSLNPGLSPEEIKTMHKIFESISDI